jgi:hypothetical protein
MIGLNICKASMTAKTLTLINSRRYVRDDNFGECRWWDANCYNHLDGWLAGLG